MQFVTKMEFARECLQDLTAIAAMEFVTELQTAVAVEIPDAWNLNICVNLGKQVADVFIFKEFLSDIFESGFFHSFLLAAYLENVDNAAHIGGLLSGFIVGTLMVIFMIKKVNLNGKN